MKKLNNQTNLSTRQANENRKTDLPGYPLYPAKDDIFVKYKEEGNVNPEEIAKSKTLNEQTGENNEKDFHDDVSGGDLDVPGSELDDEQEKVGSEDEENNYYSLGGDSHNDLDEDKGN